MTQPALYSLRYSSSAQRELEDAHAYIYFQGAPLAATRLKARLLTAIESLEAFPERGRPVGGGYRELTVVPPYVVRYRVVGNSIIVTRIRHGARRPD